MVGWAMARWARWVRRGCAVQLLSVLVVNQLIVYILLDRAK